MWVSPELMEPATRHRSHHAINLACDQKHRQSTIFTEQLVLVVSDTSGVSTIGHQAAKQCGADRCGPLHGAKILRRPGFGAGVCFIILVLKGWRCKLLRRFPHLNRLSLTTS